MYISIFFVFLYQMKSRVTIYKCKFKRVLTLLWNLKQQCNASRKIVSCTNFLRLATFHILYFPEISLKILVILGRFEIFEEEWKSFGIYWSIDLPDLWWYFRKCHILNLCVPKNGTKKGSSKSLAHACKIV